MSAIVHDGPPTYEVASGTAITKNRLVKFLAGGTIAHATTGASEHAIGVAERDVPSTGDLPNARKVAVVPLNHSGLLRLVASAAISRGAELELAANGKVATLSTGVAIGYMCISNDAAADGDTVLAAPIIS